MAAETTTKPMWHEDAECRGPSGTLFYPPNRPERRDDRDRRERRAKAICAMCSVRDDCLQLALSTNEQHGIWGGLNEMERRILILDRAN